MTVLTFETKDAWLAARRDYKRQSRAGVPRAAVNVRDEAWFARRAWKCPSTGCWLWLGTLHRSGYGIANIVGKSVKAHRLAYEAFVGPIADGMHVLHSCDTPACCNPAHLSLGDNSENVRQRVARSRSASMHGLCNPNSRMTSEMIAEARRLVANGRSRASIAREWGLSRATIERHTRSLTNAA